MVYVLQALISRAGFYIVVNEIINHHESEVVCDHLSPKELLDKTRSLCKGQDAPEIDVCQAFNLETKDGRDMRGVSALLSEAINSIIEVKEDSDIDSLFSPGGTSALNNKIGGD